MIGCCSQLYDLHEGIALDVVTPKIVVALETMIAKKYDILVHLTNLQNLISMK